MILSPVDADAKRWLLPRTPAQTGEIGTGRDDGTWSSLALQEVAESVEPNTNLRSGSSFPRCLVAVPYSCTTSLCVPLRPCTVLYVTSPTARESQLLLCILSLTTVPLPFGALGSKINRLFR